LPAAQPVLTVTLAAWYLGQTLAGRDLAAMGLVLFGVAFVIYSKVSEDARRCGLCNAQQTTRLRPPRYRLIAWSWYCRASNESCASA